MKTVDSVPTVYLVNSGYVVAEYRENTLTSVYLWGANLIKAGIGSETSYYLYNAHGDVVQLTDENGAVTKSYTYDAFGVEDEPSIYDLNPFRYCGEYYDRESGTYYLRARYYNPATGRFTQEDPHWNPGNMIYGDNPQKINEREDALGLECYVPQICAIKQSTALYTYSMGDPVNCSDPDGENAGLASGILNSASGFFDALAAVLPGLLPALGIVVGILGAITFVYEVISWLIDSIANLISAAIDAVSEYMEAAEEAKIWVRAQIDAGGVDENNLKDHSIYVILDKSTDEVVYVGRTSNFAARYYAHQRSKNARFSDKLYTMLPIATGMTLDEARALEQLLISAYTLDALCNSINSIAERNWSKFEYEFERVQTLWSDYIRID